MEAIVVIAIVIGVVLIALWARGTHAQAKDRADHFEDLHAIETYARQFRAIAAERGLRMPDEVADSLAHEWFASQGIRPASTTMESYAESTLKVHGPSWQV